MDGEEWQTQPAAAGGRPITPAEYVELLVDASMSEAAELMDGFLAWCRHHMQAWRAMNRDESWIRARVAHARSTYRLHQELIASGYSDEQRRQFLREAYAGIPQLYRLMLEREATTTQGVQVSVVYGTGDDLLARFVLRYLVEAAARANYVRFQRWQGIVDEEQLRELGSSFAESEDDAYIRDWSTVEELRFLLDLAERFGELLERRPVLSFDDLEGAVGEAGRELRLRFIAQHRYAPEQSTSPRIPVTIHGPKDPGLYPTHHDLR